MALTVSSLRFSLARCAEAARVAEADLNAADARMGDGDTGVTVRRLFAALETTAIEGTDVGAAFAKLAKVCAGATGSSLGTLVTVAMMTLAKPLQGRSEVAWRELPPLLADVRDRMLARGGASLGDKTMVDMLDAVINATEGQNAPEPMLRSATTAADAALEQFRNQPNRIGRARMFSERTIGQDDPGMLALRRLLAALSEEKTSGV